MKMNADWEDRRGRVWACEDEEGDDGLETRIREQEEEDWRYII